MDRVGGTVLYRQGITSTRPQSSDIQHGECFSSQVGLYACPYTVLYPINLADRRGMGWMAHTTLGCCALHFDPLARS